MVKIVVGFRNWECLHRIWNKTK